VKKWKIKMKIYRPLRRDVKKHLGTEMKRKRIINCFPEGKSR
jgi:hypothetical protein